jgi:hypothetical protein
MLNREELTLILVGSRGNIPCDHAICANSRSLAYRYWSEHSGARSDNNAIFNIWMALTAHEFCGTKSYIVINHYIIANYRGLTYHNTHAMIDEESSSDFCCGMDLDTGHSSNPVCIKSRQEFQPTSPQEVCDSVTPDRVDAGKTERNL